MPKGWLKFQEVWKSRQSNFEAMIGGQPGHCQSCLGHSVNNGIETSLKASSPSAATLLNPISPAILVNIYKRKEEKKLLWLRSACFPESGFLPSVRIGRVLGLCCRDGKAERVPARDNTTRSIGHNLSLLLHKHGRRFVPDAPYDIARSWCAIWSRCHQSCVQWSGQPDCHSSLDSRIFDSWNTLD